MAQVFLFNIAERVLEKVAGLAVEEFSLAFNVKNDLRKLQETMTSIKAVLVDAERQQQQNEKLRLCMWKLRDIFYDAEDVLDEFECEALRKEVWNHPSISMKVRFKASLSFPFAFSMKMVHKIKEINTRLDKIAIEWERFNLGQGGENRYVLHRDQSYSFVNSFDVIGRDEDKENIVHLLMQPCGSGSIPVIPIVGIGGLGKTTLAQFVYNDERVTSLFPLKIWVCVSDMFDLTRLLKEIIHSINKENCEDFTVDALRTRLGRLLNNKKFLLVLDDVWNENRVKWIELRDLLMSLSDLSQSKIIVTTRSLKVASIMSSAQPYQLEGLPHEDCLTVFRKWAFNDGDDRRYPNLMRIGEEIVRKCKGVPLAVRTLGSLLFFKTDEREWMSIRDSEMWRLEQRENDILPVLKLSYNHLPSHLQRCLACLSLYKKDHFYESNEIISLWMANGLLEYPQQKEEWEDVGSRYLNELWSRCFIQDVQRYSFYFTFKMHDLIHDLALDVSQKECRTIKRCQKGSIIDDKVRHLSFSDNLKVSQDLKKLKCVRTVIIQDVFDEFLTLEPFINFCALNFKYLRVLNLSHSPLKKTLPGSIGTLKHLRYLDLSNCNYIKALPSSFYELRSLLTLRMRGVGLMKLSKRMQSLVKLRYLAITINAKHLKKIRPGCWSSLQFLGVFNCDNLKCLFEGLQYLVSLRTLQVGGCSQLVSLPRSLKFLTKLEHLAVTLCGAINLQMELDDEEDGRDLNLSLKTLTLWRLDALTDLPQLLLEGSARSLQVIRIDTCFNFEVLPKWLPNLTSLEKLELIDCPNLSNFPRGMDRLTMLRRLKIRGCPKLERQIPTKLASICTHPRG